MKLRSAIACSLLLYALTGCHGSATNKPLPQRSPGLWETTLTPQAQSGARPRPTTTRQCTAPEVDTQLLLLMAPGQESCAPPQIRQQGDEWHVRTRCSVHESRIDTHFILRGDFAQEYSGQIETRYQKPCPQRYPDCRQKQEVQARYLGLCPEGMRPGDLRLPNGILLNQLDPL